MEMRAQRVGDLLMEASLRLDASGSESARLDAELLLGHVLGIDRTALITHSDMVLTTGQQDRYDALLTRRVAGEPVAYIRGLKEFYGAVIAVDPRVLIPRPETETLVELALARISDDLTGALRDEDTDRYLVWDMGTGSGALPIAVALELRRRRYGDAVHFYLSDLSEDALAVATINAVSHGLADLFTFVQADLTDAVPGPRRRADLLLANLPYIPSSVVPDLPVATSFEPVEALDGGHDGLDVIRRLLPSLPDAIVPHGAALLEIGGDQADLMMEVAAELLPHWRCTVHPDLAGSPRVAQLERVDA
jgi:release factor glutamine methyltransferase